MRYTVTVAGRTFSVEVTGDGVLLDGTPLTVALSPVPGTPLRRLCLEGGAEHYAMRRVAGGWELTRAGVVWQAEVTDERVHRLREVAGAGGQLGGRHVVKAPMPGLVLRVAVAPGAVVTTGESLVVLEAMKMENDLTAPAGGRVEAVYVSAGQAVEKGTALLELISAP